MRKSSPLTQLPGRLAIALIRLYQIIISPMLGPTCRFSPSCSHYACACLGDHGLLRGSWLTLRRLSRCHPWHPGGYDPPPPARDVGAATGCRMKDLGLAEVARPEQGRGDTSTQTPG